MALKLFEKCTNDGIEPINCIINAMDIAVKVFSEQSITNVINNIEIEYAWITRNILAYGNSQDHIILIAYIKQNRRVSHHCIIFLL